MDKYLLRNLPFGECGEKGNIAVQFRRWCCSFANHYLKLIGCIRLNKPEHKRRDINLDVNISINICPTQALHVDGYFGYFRWWCLVAVLFVHTLQLAHFILH